MGKRLALLAGVPAFGRLPEAVLEGLAARLGEKRYPAGGVVVAEGDVGDRPDSLPSLRRYNARGDTPSERRPRPR